MQKDDYEERGETAMQEHNVKEIRDLIIYTKTIPAHPASFAEFPNALYPDICDYLTSHNIPRLYTHQAEMFEKELEEDGVDYKEYTAADSNEIQSVVTSAVQEVDASTSRQTTPWQPTRHHRQYLPAGKVPVVASEQAHAAWRG